MQKTKERKTQKTSQKNLLSTQVKQFAAQNALFSKNSKIVVGLSGGPDSVFLLHFFSELYREGEISELSAAHLDHEWRTDSGKDTQFCQDLAKKYGVQFFSTKLSELAFSEKPNGSLEEMGRNARRFFFEQVRKKQNADLIALAHHAQDQQETFFIRLLRGATLSGLTGMQPKQGRYIRPLLETNKSNLVAFLDAHNISYLTDPSNESDQFLRNRIRNNVIPALRVCDERFDKKYAHTLASLQRTENFLVQETKKHFEKVALKKEMFFQLDLKKLFQLHPVLYERVLLYWLCQEQVQFPVSRGFFQELVKFLQQPHGGTHQLHHDWRLIKQKGMVRVEKG